MGTSLNMNKYNILDTKDKLEWFDSLIKDVNLISLDTETNGLLLYKTTIIGFSISCDSSSGVYVPLLNWVPNEESSKNRKIKGIVHSCFMDGEFECVWTGRLM